MITCEKSIKERTVCSGSIFQGDLTSLGFGAHSFEGTLKKLSYKSMWQNKQLIPSRKTLKKKSYERNQETPDSKA